MYAELSNCDQFLGFLMGAHETCFFDMILFILEGGMAAYSFLTLESSGELYVQQPLGPNLLMGLIL